MDVIELELLNQNRPMDSIPELNKFYFDGSTLPWYSSLLGTEFGFDGSSCAGTHWHSVEIWIHILKNLNNCFNFECFKLINTKNKQNFLKKIKQTIKKWN